MRRGKHNKLSGTKKDKTPSNEPLQKSFISKNEKFDVCTQTEKQKGRAN